ncbi:MAG: FtsX-like permease family protein [Lachnospira sp.]
MGKSVIKDLLREIKKTFGRFFAIFAIVAIGVAFFAGVTASSGDMKNSTDAYYDEYNMSDLRLLSSIGFNEDDVAAISQVDGVKGICPAYSIDAVIKKDSLETAVHIMSVPDNTSSDNENYINQLRIKEGRLPQKTGECVVRYEDTKDNFNIGDVITLASGTEEDITDSLNDVEYTVVGIVYTPYYVSYDLGTTNVGSGKINYLMYISEDEFMSDYFNEIFATVEGAKELDTYSEEYEDKVKETADRIHSISQERIDERKAEIDKMYEDALAQAMKEAEAVIYEHVVESLTEQYRNYFIGMDVSSIIEPYIQPAYEKALAGYDFSYIEEQAKQDFESRYGNYNEWKWYELTRQEQYSYKDYESSTNRMKAIATVFPIFFIIVSALVCLTTMTRMVAEERGIIGTYKALGYSKRVIAFKYIAYAFIASVTGGIVGCVIGLKLFPLIIYNSWNIIYQLPSIQYTKHLVLSIVAITSMVIVTVVAAVFSCYSELEEVPSELMRPKAPKSGKKILLEHIGFVWNRLSFSIKVTMRNLFLYKKRFFMTVIGIAGCTALMTAGFGIKNSVEGLIHNQFDMIIHYDSVISYTDNITDEDINALKSDISSDTCISDYMSIYGYSEEVKCNDETQTAEYIVVNDKENFKNYITLRTRKKHTPIELSDKGVVITEKMSKDLDVKTGDTITVRDITGKEAVATISGISEMYVNHYIYIDSDYYAELFGSKPEDNRLLLVLGEDYNEETESHIGEEYLSRDYVKGISFLNSNVIRFENMIQSLDLVTWVLIISAGLLAFVVLYNLTNVNISERRREIATIKVLGFFNPEVGIYVYRENIILTLIGGLFGLVLGRLLHIYIMLTVEMDAVMFGYFIKPSSYLLSYLITIVFSLIVNFLMYPALNKLPMVESLKSVE